MSQFSMHPQQPKMIVKPLTRHFLPAAASLLHQSYYNDPLFMEIFKADKPDYAKRLLGAIVEEVKFFWQAKEHVMGLYINEQLLGVACLISPDFGLSVGRFWHWRLKMLLAAGYLSTKQMIEKEEKLRAAMSDRRYYMLAFMAIQPNHQHHGLGQYLMSAIEEMVKQDTESSGVAVYVTVAKYLDFFNGFNFQYVCDVSVGYVTGKLLFCPLSSTEPNQ